MHHQDLAVAVGPGTDPNRRNIKGLANLPTQIRRNPLEHNRKGASLLNRSGVFQNPRSTRFTPALNPVPPHRVDGLGSQANVPHHGHLGAHDALDGLGDQQSTFELHGVGTRLLDETDRATHSILGAHLITPKGHIGDDQGALGTPGHQTGVIDDLIQGHGQGRITALDHVSQGIPHQQQVYTRLVENAREGKVVRGEHGEGFALAFALGEGAHRNSVLSAC